MRVLAVVAVALAAAGTAQPRSDFGIGAPRTCAQPPRSPWVDVDPAWSHDGARVAFIRRGNGAPTLVVAQADGAGARRLFAATASPSWFPDGRIAYEWQRTIWLVAAHGAQADRLIDDAQSPAVSPDGTRVAFVRDGVVWTAEVAHVNVRNARPVTTKGSPSFPHVDAHPAWSPDGKQIAFTRDRGWDRGGIDVWVVSSDAAGVQQVTRNESYNAEPTWSPDGTRIAFRAWIQNLNSAIHTARLDGSRERALTQNTNLSFDADRGSPAWSSRGEIAFAASRYDGFGGTWGSEIRAMPPSGVEERRLTYHCQFNGEPDEGAPIHGTALADVVYGYGGDDRIWGYRGSDRLYAGADDDRVDGGLGDDRIDGALGSDVLLGGPGNDTLLAKDGYRDTLDCGPGRDVAAVDRRDRVIRNCERVLRSPPQPAR